MIRGALIIGCIFLVVVVAFGAFKCTPSQLNEVLRREYAANVALLGRDRALQLLDSVVVSKAPPPKPAKSATVVKPARRQSGAAMSAALGRVANVNVLNNANMDSLAESLDGLLRLALFRLGSLWFTLPALMLLTCATVVDGIVRRTVKAHEFSPHDPEVVTIAASGVVLLLFFVLGFLAWPGATSPLLIPSVCIAIAFVLKSAVSNYRA